MFGLLCDTPGHEECLEELQICPVRTWTMVELHSGVRGRQIPYRRLGCDLSCMHTSKHNGLLNFSVYLDLFFYVIVLKLLGSSPWSLSCFARVVYQRWHHRGTQVSSRMGLYWVTREREGERVVISTPAHAHAHTHTHMHTHTQNNLHPSVLWPWCKMFLMQFILSHIVLKFFSRPKIMVLLICLMFSPKIYKYFLCCANLFRSTS